MISVRLAGKRTPLNAGDWICHRPPSQVFTDADRPTMRKLIAEISSGKPWGKAVRDIFEKDNPWLARIILDPNRDLFFREHRRIAKSTILDIGCGWGQQSLALAPHNDICAVEPNGDRLNFVRAVASQIGLSHKIAYINSDLLDIEFEEQFDVATCIGVLEWVGNFRDDSGPQSLQRNLLRRTYSALRPEGCCIIGIENRMGLKYLLGARDDHTGTRGICNLDYTTANRHWHRQHAKDLRVITYALPEYRMLLKETGFVDTQFYAAFPDYKLPKIILPCDLPGPVSEYFCSGGFIEEHDGWDGSALDMQESLASHYRTLAEAGIAHYFAPSFFIVATK